jgi:menaquinone-dependent protoporphyrinogen oxidase
LKWAQFRSVCKDLLLTQSFFLKKIEKHLHTEKAHFLRKVAKMVVLIAYASSAGSTQEIASRIASQLEKAGNEVECLPVNEVHQLSEHYDPVLIGSAIHSQSWLPEATDFVHKYREALASRSVWVFSAGMWEGLPKMVRAKWGKAEEKRIIEGLSKDIDFRGHKLFAGSMRREQIPAIVRMILVCCGGRYGDLRDWDAIDGWADSLAEELKKPAVPAVDREA